MECLGVEAARLLNLDHVLYRHALRMCRSHLRRSILPLLNPFGETLNLLLLLLIVLLLLYEILLLALHKGSVVSGIALDVVIFNLISYICNLVKEHSIMRYNHNRPVIRLKVSLQPFDCRHIKMVRRLVKKHDIRSCKKELNKSHLSLLSSRKASYRSF